MTSREELRRQVQDASRRVQPVEIPEWGGGYYVRSFSTMERDFLELWSSRQEGEGEGALRGFRAAVAVRALSDSDGRRIYSDEEVEVFDNADGQLVERIREAALAFNGYTAEEVDELEGNSGSGPHAASCSDSRLPSEVAPSVSSNGT